ncbi:MAG: hypothetical protein ACRDRU_12145 [Pseudonocardiaceae bacterium]
MAGGFGTSLEALQAAGSTARLVGGNAAAVDLPGAVEEIAGALPGSTAAATSGELVQAWGAAMWSWSAEVTAHGDNLHASAQLYQATDEQAETSFTGTGEGPVH